MFIVNVEGAIFNNDKWLIIKRSNKEEHAGGLLSLVGGKVELEGISSDILERTLKREIDEEVGVIVKEKLKYIYSTSFVIGSDKNVVNIVFLCEYASGEAIAKSPDEVASVYWMTAQQIYEHRNAPDYLKESIKKAVSIR